jgi:hypothetical protein
MGVVVQMLHVTTVDSLPRNISTYANGLFHHSTKRSLFGQLDHCHHERECSDQ